MSIRINLALEASEMFLSLHMVFSLERAAVVWAILEFWISIIICSDLEFKWFLPKYVTGRFDPVWFRPELFRP